MAEKNVTVTKVTTYTLDEDGVEAAVLAYLGLDKRKSSIEIGNAYSITPVIVSVTETYDEDEE